MTRKQRWTTAEGSFIDGSEASLVDDAYDAIVSAIRDGVLPASYQASEQEIADRYKMSRTPVHEAMIRLQQEGLVRVLSRKGVLIRALTPDDLREIYDVMIALEGEAADLIAAMPKDDREAAAHELTDMTCAMEEAGHHGEFEIWCNADTAFHAARDEHARNGRISRIMKALDNECHRARRVALKLRLTLVRSTAEHRKIIEAIRLGDRTTAMSAARLHRVRARDDYLTLLERYGIKQL